MNDYCHKIYKREKVENNRMFNDFNPQYQRVLYELGLLY